MDTHLDVYNRGTSILIQEELNTHTVSVAYMDVYLAHG